MRLSTKQMFGTVSLDVIDHLLGEGSIWTKFPPPPLPHGNECCHNGQCQASVCKVCVQVLFPAIGRCWAHDFCAVPSIPFCLQSAVGKEILMQNLGFGAQLALAGSRC